MKPAINPNKIVVFTGAGISVSSGLEAFRDSDLKMVAGTKQHRVLLANPLCLQRGVAIVKGKQLVGKTQQFEYGMDKGVAAHTHERLAPDEIQPGSWVIQHR